MTKEKGLDSISSLKASKIYNYITRGQKHVKFPQLVIEDYQQFRVAVRMEVRKDFVIYSKGCAEKQVSSAENKAA